MILLQCSKCKHWLCPTDFALATKTKRGRQRYCLDCHARTKAETRAANKAKHAADGIDLAAMPDQWCPQCETWKPATEMSIDASTPTGLRGICKGCAVLQYQQYYGQHTDEVRAKRIQRRLDNPEPELAYGKAYRATHKEERAAYGAQYRARYPEEHKQWQKEWEQKNPLRRQELNAKRRARKKNAPKVERIVRTVVFERDKWICQLCFRKTNPAVKHPHPDAPTIDHIIPLANGGSHTYANVVCAHSRCNVSKKNRAIPQQIRLF